jgi:endonuclease/exonuclease/phosphatase family metal-dependent hydrolase
MRIATFNIWNNNTLWLERLEAICEEIKNVNSDVIALQEVRNNIGEDKNNNVAQYIANQTGYPYCIFNEYPDSPDEGLAFLSKIPFETTDSIWNKNVKESNYCASRVTFKYKEKEYGITNVHLNWKSTIIRKEQVQTVYDWIMEETNLKPFEVLCGDFNDEPYSDIHRYLKQKGWVDVAQLQEEKSGMEALPTLDFQNNLNLSRSSPNQVTQYRFDWILVKHHTNLHMSFLEKVKVFGTNLNNKTKVMPSDHYGVFMDIKLI